MKQSKTAGNIAIIIMGLVFLCVGGGLGGLGAMYVLGAHDANTAEPGRWLTTGIVMIVIGMLIWCAAAVGAFLAWRRMQPKPEQKVTIQQKVELGGDIDLASLKCTKCNAALTKKAITIQDGTVLVSCPYCGATYQVVEEPKW